jgi:ParB/RepB/Spo0J family partition protein
MNTASTNASNQTDAKRDLFATDTNEATPDQSPSSLRLVLLETGLIRPGETFNRNPDYLDTPEFEALVASILQTRGNTQPIAVALIPTEQLSSDSPHRYILISGHRRWAACQMLGFKVLAMIRSTPASDDPLLDRLIENHHRQNLSPLEFGRQVDALMSQRPDLSARKIGKALGCDHSLILKARDVAKLPPEIVACFASPNDIRYKDADQLKAACAQASEALLAEAKRIVTEQQPLAAAQVVQRLVEAATQTPQEGAMAEGGERFTTPAETTLEIDGQAVGKVGLNKKGHPTISLSVVLTEAQQVALTKSIEAFLRRRVLRGPTANSPVSDQPQLKPAANADRVSESKRRAAA